MNLVPCAIVTHPLLQKFAMTIDEYVILPKALTEMKDGKVGKGVGHYTVTWLEDKSQVSHIPSIHGEPSRVPSHILTPPPPSHSHSHSRSRRKGEHQNTRTAVAAAMTFHSLGIHMFGVNIAGVRRPNRERKLTPFVEFLPTYHEGCSSSTR